MKACQFVRAADMECGLHVIKATLVERYPDGGEIRLNDSTADLGMVSPFGAGSI